MEIGLDFLEDEELLRFFHVNKTDMSLMENPHTFIRQLRDHKLIPEDRYKKMDRMKSKDNLKRALYEALDWLESERSQYIRTFWRSVFKDTIIYQYSTLQLLRNKLMDGSYKSDIQLPEGLEKEDTDKRKRKERSEAERGKGKTASSAKKRRKRRGTSDDDDDDEEQPSPSSQLTPASPQKRGEKSDIWTWPLFKSVLRVKCGHEVGTLYRGKLAKGEKCILVDKQWFTPTEFERFAGKKSSKNWKLSIRCNGTPLGKLIQEGYLKSARYKGGRKTAKKTHFPPDHLSTVSEGDEDEDEDEESDQDSEDQASSSSRKSSAVDTDDEEEEEEQPELQPDVSQARSKKVFKVTCGTSTGTLHKYRFASGICGKCIRTETSWVTPMEFARESSGQTDLSWRKVIQWEGKQLSVLIEAKILRIHAVNCPCKYCSKDIKDLEDQENDDECCICKKDENEEGDKDEELVVCDHCPRSFHQKCHLPHMDEANLGDDSPWRCTFCEYRSGREQCYQDELEEEAAMSRQISHHMLECQYLLLYLCSANEEQTFAKDPNLLLADYSTVIDTPMWLGNVADKLQQQLYKTVGEFVSDVQLIFTNCASYNRENADVLATGNRLKSLFDEELKKVFNICEKTVEQ